MACFPYPFLVWRPRSGNLLEFLDETYPAKTRRMGLRNGENFNDPDFNRFYWFTVWQTDGRTGDGSALSMLPRPKNRSVDDWHVILTITVLLKFPKSLSSVMYFSRWRAYTTLTRPLFGWGWGHPSPPLSLFGVELSSGAPALWSA